MIQPIQEVFPRMLLSVVNPSGDWVFVVIATYCLKYLVVHRANNGVVPPRFDMKRKTVQNVPLCQVMISSCD